MADHGTVARYKKHLRDDDEPCAACRAAQAREVAKHRKNKKRDRSAETRAATIRRRALNRLATEYPDRLEVLLAEEASRSEATALL